MGRRGAADEGVDGALVEGASTGSVGFSMALACWICRHRPISISAAPHTFGVTVYVPGLAQRPFPESVRDEQPVAGAAQLL